MHIPLNRINPNTVLISPTTTTYSQALHPSIDRAMASSSSSNSTAASLQTGPALLAAIAAAAASDGGEGVQALVRQLKRQQQQQPTAAPPLLTYQNEEGSSALHAAVSLLDADDSLALLRCLMEDVGGGGRSDNEGAAAPLALRDGRMRSPLLLAAEKGNAAAFLYLWERRGRGQDQEPEVEADCFGRGPLHWWCKHGDAACVAAVLGGGGRDVDVNACTTSGETPLVWALQAAAASSASKDIEAMVGLLLDKGADVRAATNGMGQRPLDLLPPAGRGNELQERLRGLLEARVRVQGEVEEEQEEGQSPAVAMAAESAAAPAMGKAPTVAVTKPAVGSLLSFGGKGPGTGAGAGRAMGVGVGAGPAKKLKIKLKGQE